MVRKQHDQAEVLEKPRAPLRTVESSPPPKVRDDSPLGRAMANADRYAQDTDCTNATAADVVGYFALCYENLYKIPPEDLYDRRKWAAAVKNSQEVIERYGDASYGYELIRFAVHRYQHWKNPTKPVLGWWFVDKVKGDFRLHLEKNNLFSEDDRPKTLGPVSQPRSSRPTKSQESSKDDPDRFRAQIAIRNCMKSKKRKGAPTICRIPQVHRHLVRVLAEYIDANFECWPSQETIADDMGVSDRYVRELMDDLETGKLSEISNVTITRTPRPRESGRGGSKSFSIRLNIIDRSSRRDDP